MAGINVDLHQEGDAYIKEVKSIEQIGDSIVVEARGRWLPVQSLAVLPAEFIIKFTPASAILEYYDGDLEKFNLGKALKKWDNEWEIVADESNPDEMELVNIENSRIEELENTFRILEDYPKLFKAFKEKFVCGKEVIEKMEEANFSYLVEVSDSVKELEKDGWTHAFDDDAIDWDDITFLYYEDFGCIPDYNNITDYAMGVAMGINNTIMREAEKRGLKVELKYDWNGKPKKIEVVG